MEGEINNFIMVWTIAAVTMCYSHMIGKFIPQGKARLLAIFPAILILLLLPLKLTSIHLGGPTSFILGWLSTFKLLLFALGKGPLSSNPPLSLSHFVPLSLLPIKLFQQQKQHPSNPSNTPNDQLVQCTKLSRDDLANKEDVSKNPDKYQITKKGNKSPLNYAFATMVIVLAFLIPLYAKKENFHPKFTLFLYSLHMYIGLEFIFALITLFTRKVMDIEIEPQFNEPYLSTSLQDFWGRRWNLMVNRILHPTVYSPVVSVCTRFIGRRWAPLSGILATFAVSGVMHELIFYYIKREKRTWEAWEPSWDSMCFFLLHGVCLAVEVAIKKSLKGRWQLPRLLSWLLTVVFVIYTALWLFVPALVRCHVYEKGSRELNALNEIVKDIYAVLRFASFHVASG
ncbi:hypothetical protein RIF29_40796 [Crotalaria pallida]|uniref:Wax synthase domain-containing protein n=1 Tax=Crotalaria pallida TaxID=3830 RepID=A0AAN9HS07_CROPI